MARNIKQRERQQRAIELLVYSPYKTLQSIADECEVSRDTLHRWRTEDEEFKAALDKALKERWKAAESVAMNTMISLCESGDFKASKYVLDSLGYEGTKKVDANVSADVSIEIDIEE